MKTTLFALLLIGLILATSAASNRFTRQSNTNDATRQRQCSERCLSTNEYNPVCGTNGETYQNIGKLNCAKGCGTTVDMQRRGTCQPL